MDDRLNRPTELRNEAERLQAAAEFLIVSAARKRRLAFEIGKLNAASGRDGQVSPPAALSTGPVSGRADETKEG